jgi:hypothetical protein
VWSEKVSADADRRGDGYDIVRRQRSVAAIGASAFFWETASAEVGDTGHHDSAHFRADRGTDQLAAKSGRALLHPQSRRDHQTVSLSRCTCAIFP